MLRENTKIAKIGRGHKVAQVEFSPGLLPDLLAGFNENLYMPRNHLARRQVRVRYPRVGPGALLRQEGVDGGQAPAARRLRLPQLAILQGGAMSAKMSSKIVNCF